MNSLSWVARIRRGGSNGSLGLSHLGLSHFGPHSRRRSHSSATDRGKFASSIRRTGVINACPKAPQKVRSLQAGHTSFAANRRLVAHTHTEFEASSARVENTIFLKNRNTRPAQNVNFKF